MLPPRRAAHSGPTEQLPISRVTACVSGERPTACSPFGEMGRYMTLRWAFFLLFFASTAFSQTPPPGSSSNDQSPAAAQTKPHAEDQEKPHDSAQPSTLEVTPGSPVLKQNDFWAGTAVPHPLLRPP